MAGARQAAATALGVAQAAVAGTVGLDAWWAFAAGAPAGAAGLGTLSLAAMAAAIGVATAPYRHRAWNGVAIGVAGSAWLAFTGPVRDEVLAVGGLALAVAALASCWRSVPPEFGGQR